MATLDHSQLEASFRRMVDSIAMEQTDPRKAVFLLRISSSSHAYSTATLREILGA